MQTWDLVQPSQSKGWMREKGMRGDKGSDGLRWSNWTEDQGSEELGCICGPRRDAQIGLFLAVIYALDVPELSNGEQIQVYKSLDVEPEFVTTLMRSYGPNRATVRRSGTPILPAIEEDMIFITVILSTCEDGAYEGLVFPTSMADPQPLLPLLRVQRRGGRENQTPVPGTSKMGT